QFPAGKYFVDVILNQERVGKAILEISSDDEIKNSLCLKPEWLNNAGILFQSSSYSSYFDNEKKCYRIGDEPHTKVDFDYGAQSLKFNVPQAYLPSQAKSDFWDYGINGSRLKYYGNFNKSSNNDINAFGNFDLGINIGRWVLASNSNITHSGDKNKFSTRDLSLSTAINPIRGDFILGKSQTRTNIFSDFGFYGMA
ncbi:TPA: fimbria/pilus outer membrane usher protein, partial [Escherichia coli]|nr:fimbria/pilus outer membrane usher protein [Escherichia coli]